MTGNEITTLHLECHCGVHRYPLPVSSSSLPFSAWTCHCGSCRHGTGAPFVTSGAVPGLATLFPGVSTPDFHGLPSTLTAYGSTRAARIFCSTCGTPIANPWTNTKNEVVWAAALGALDLGDLPPEKAYGELTTHVHVAPTGDGGFARWFPQTGTFWTTWSRATIFNIPEEVGKSNVHTNAQGQDVLKCSCKCKGVQLEILRPSATPDGPGVEVMAASPDKWLTACCHCRSCRISLGHLLPSGMWVGREHIQWLSKGTLRVYESSPARGMKRTFCGTCGACVTTGYDENPWLYVHVGLIELDGDGDESGPKEGLAGVLSKWTERKEEWSMAEEARDPKLRDDIMQGMSRDGALKVSSS